MMTESTEAAPAGPQWHNPIERFTTASYIAAASILISAGETALPIDPTAREVEVPRGSVLFEHLAQVALAGGSVYLTRHGRRVAAVVPSDVAELLEDEEPEREPAAGLHDLVDDYESRLGPVPPEIAAEVDRQWDAALARL